jgi:hypothetical protein
MMKVAMRMCMLQGITRKPSTLTRSKPAQRMNPVAMKRCFHLVLRNNKMVEKEGQ